VEMPLCKILVGVLSASFLKLFVAHQEEKTVGNFNFIRYQN